MTAWLPTGRRRVLLAIGAALLALAAAGAAWLAFFSGPPFVVAYRQGPLEIATPWARATPTGATIGGGYLAVRTAGRDGDRLLGAASPLATRIDLHTMVHRGTVMEMRPAPGGFAVAPGEVLTLDPHGAHLMFVGLAAPLKEGDRIPVTLSFERAGSVAVDFLVAGIAADTAPEARK